MSGNKILSVGPYSGMTIDEVVAADPWYVVSMAQSGGNHGISASMLARAERLVEEYTEDRSDPHDEYEVLIQSQADAFGIDYEYDSWGERVD